MTARVREIGGTAYAGAQAASAPAQSARMTFTGGIAQAVAPVVEPVPITFRVRRLVLEDGTEIQVTDGGEFKAHTRATTGE